jgi:hypothetical protein
MSVRQFPGLHVFLSASVPHEFEKNEQKLQDKLHLVTVLGEQIFRRKGILVFGGHPSITPLIHQTASTALNSEVVSGPPVRLYQLSGFKKSMPRQVADSRVFGDINWVGSHTPDQTDEFTQELDVMRQKMVNESNAAVFGGGKTKGYLGPMPGIRREYQLFTETHPDRPVYLVGLLGGETARIINELESRGARENNGLSQTELHELHHSEEVDVAVNLILADLLDYAQNQVDPGASD